MPSFLFNKIVTSLDVIIWWANHIAIVASAVKVLITYMSYFVLFFVAGHHGRRVRGSPGQKSLVSRSMSGGDYESSGQVVCSKMSHHSSGGVRLQRQSSSDNSVVSLYPPIEVDCDEDPIMVWKFHSFLHPVVQAPVHLLKCEVPELCPSFVTKATTSKLLFIKLFSFLLSLCHIIVQIIESVLLGIIWLLLLMAVIKIKLVVHVDST